MSDQVAHINNWFVMGDGLVGSVTNHPRQSTFDGPTQWTSNISSDLSGLNEGDIVTADSGQRFLLGVRAW